MQTHHERGMALVLALFLISALSALAGSLMFLSQTETYASMNYRKMSQTRYAAESAVQKASSFLLDVGLYSMPAGVVAQLNRTVSPVTYNGQAVTLSPVVAQSNYPDSTVKTAFSSTAQGSLTAGNTNLTYSASATLLAVQTFEAYGGTQGIVQTWRITGTGAITGSTNTTVEVSSVVETPKVPASSYAAFATDPSCGAITFQGTTDVKSYDSTSLTGIDHSDPFEHRWQCWNKRQPFDRRQRGCVRESLHASHRRRRLHGGCCYGVDRDRARGSARQHRAVAINGLLSDAADSGTLAHPRSRTHQ